MTTASITLDLEPTVEELLERHLSTAPAWFPHELVPWSRGRDFVPGEERSEADSSVDSVARIALTINLLTEDNLPYYFRALNNFGGDGAWGEWTRRWTAEEGRHSIVIRDYLTVTRAVDPVALETARIQQVSSGVVPKYTELCDTLVYTTLQELATRISHRNTGNLLADPAGRAIMNRVGGDENLHFLFYRDLASAALERDPSTMVIAMDRIVRGFAMPGTGISDFNRHARVMAAAGIYDFSIHHEKILVPVILNHWQLRELEGLNDEAEQARDRLLRFMDRLARVARRLRDRAAREQAPAVVDDDDEDSLVRAQQA